MENVNRSLKLVVPDSFKGRLDWFLYKYLPPGLSLSRSKIKKLILTGSITQRGKKLSDPSKKVKPMEEFWFLKPAPALTKIIPQKIFLDILFEDDHLLLINKAPGMVVHPGSGVPDGTLANALIHHCGSSIASVGSLERPGIVHRIDRLTSGVLVVAKTEAAYQGLIPQFADHSITRRYLALSWGRLQNSLQDYKQAIVSVSGHSGQYTISSNIGRHLADRKKMSVLKKGGKFAISKFREIGKFFLNEKLSVSLIECELETGRTHQLRVHLSHIGNAIVGDQTYGRKNKQRVNSNELIESLEQFKRQALHAAHLGFVHPISRKGMEFNASPPDDFKTLLINLGFPNPPLFNEPINI